MLDGCYDFFDTSEDEVPRGYRETSLSFQNPVSGARQSLISQDSATWSCPAAFPLAVVLAPLHEDKLRVVSHRYNVDGDLREEPKMLTIDLLVYLAEINSGRYVSPSSNHGSKWRYFCDAIGPWNLILAVKSRDAVAPKKLATQ